MRGVWNLSVGRQVQSMSEASAPKTAGALQQALVPTKTVIEKSRDLIDEVAEIPDGPNVGPSPNEHRAAQGELPAVPSAIQDEPAQRPPRGTEGQP